MEVNDPKGGKTAAVDTTLLPSIFCVKFYHITYDTWKASIKSKKEYWEEI